MNFNDSEIIYKEKFIIKKCTVFIWAIEYKDVFFIYFTSKFFDNNYLNKYILA